MTDTLLTNTNVRHLFPTPLITADMPPEMATRINAKIKEMVLAKEKTMPSANASNYGGWQSDDKIVEWGGVDITTVVTALRELVDSLTVQLHRGGSQRGNLPWKINGWANLNRKGDSNVPHIHPGAYWSAVYYVAIDDAEDPKVGGTLKLIDPRGGLPLMYCPVLRAGIDGYMSAGNSELYHPRAGQCVIFPSWLSHSVGAYHGTGTRISLAFNFSI